MRLTNGMIKQIALQQSRKSMEILERDKDFVTIERSSIVCARDI